MAYRLQGLYPRLSGKMLSITTATTEALRQLTLTYSPLWDDPLAALCAAWRATSPFRERVSGARVVFSTGREHDGATGLHYYRARYYHPGLQRFISEDPIGFAGGDPNLYAYVGNNPLGFRDPTGDIAIAAPVVIGGAAIVALWLASPQGQQAVRDAVEGAQQFAETAIESLQSLMGRRQRETGLENVSDEEISRRAKDKSIPWEERKRYIAEDKFRKKRNINKERGGPNKFSGLNLIELAPPLELTAPDAINLSGRKDR